MTVLLIVLTVVEVLLLVAVLAFYLMRIAESLRTTASYLARVSFGVRAIETQCEPIGTSVTKINDQLEVIADELAQLARLAESGREG